MRQQVLPVHCERDLQRHTDLVGVFVHPERGPSLQMLPHRLSTVLPFPYLASHCKGGKSVIAAVEAQAAHRRTNRV